MTANLLQIAGLAAVTVGVGMIFVPAAVIVAGVGVMAFGLALERG
jgi:hypothetical protein